MSSALTVESLSFAYGARQVLRDVAFSLQPGERVALIGPNGAGKTTLLRLLAGMLVPSAGSIRCGAALLTSLAPRVRARHLAYLPQNTWLHFALSVREVVALARYPHVGAWRAFRAQDHEAVRSALERFELAALADRTLADLSGGERQRVFLARAIAQGADTLMLDEPTASLDVGHRLALAADLARLARAGKSVLVVTQDLPLAAEFFDRLILLGSGAVVGDGPPRDVLQRAAFRDVFGVEAEWGAASPSPTFRLCPAASGS